MVTRSSPLRGGVCGGLAITSPASNHPYEAEGAFHEVEDNKGDDGKRHKDSFEFHSA